MIKVRGDVERDYNSALEGHKCGTTALLPLCLLGTVGGGGNGVGGDGLP